MGRSSSAQRRPSSIARIRFAKWPDRIDVAGVGAAGLNDPEKLDLATGDQAALS